VGKASRCCWHQHKTKTPGVSLSSQTHGGRTESEVGEVENCEQIARISLYYTELSIAAKHSGGKEAASMESELAHAYGGASGDAG
jgi:hypothetical protein